MNAANPNSKGARTCEKFHSALTDLLVRKRATQRLAEQLMAITIEPGLREAKCHELLTGLCEIRVISKVFARRRVVVSASGRQP